MIWPLAVRTGGFSLVQGPQIGRPSGSDHTGACNWQRGHNVPALWLLPPAQAGPDVGWPNQSKPGKKHGKGKRPACTPVRRSTFRSSVDVSIMAKLPQASSRSCCIGSSVMRPTSMVKTMLNETMAITPRRKYGHAQKTAWRFALRTLVEQQKHGLG